MRAWKQLQGALYSLASDFYAQTSFHPCQWLQEQPKQPFTTLRPPSLINDWFRCIQRVWNCSKLGPVGRKGTKDTPSPAKLCTLRCTSVVHTLFGFVAFPSRMYVIHWEGRARPFRVWPAWCFNVTRLPQEIWHHTAAELCCFLAFQNCSNNIHLNLVTSEGTLAPLWSKLYQFLDNKPWCQP